MHFDLHYILRYCLPRIASKPDQRPREDIIILPQNVLVSNETPAEQLCFILYLGHGDISRSGRNQYGAAIKQDAPGG
jgi:hypothetical protein